MDIKPTREMMERVAPYSQTELSAADVETYQHFIKRNKLKEVGGGASLHCMSDEYIIAGRHIQLIWEIGGSHIPSGYELVKNDWSMLD